MDGLDLGKAKAIHFIGIGGIGISAIARMMLLEGKKVSGSDLAESEIVSGLRKLGARIIIGQEVGHIPEDTEMVIYTIAIKNDNPEFAEAKNRGLKVLSYPETLGQISKNKYTIAISGTHGKTTTTAMISKILIDCKLEPTVIVGSFLKDAKSNFVAGKGKYFVVEACEYKRSFLNLNPKVLVITNIDADHLDYYKNIEGVTEAFREMVAKVPKDGFIICDPNAPHMKQAISSAAATVVDYTKFLHLVPRLLLPGKHNISNAAAALAVAHVIGVDIFSAKHALKNFSGTWRRFEYRGRSKEGALIYDDYGHHPTEIEATLQGAREFFPDKKIVVIFQPHLYSRTKDHLVEFGKCFRYADEVILLPIYGAREIDPGDITSEMVVAEIKKNAQAALFASTFAEAAIEASLRSRREDLILTLGAGEASKVADILVKN